MKYLVFILLLSCGHNETPPPKDIKDSDGDQISNYDEGPTDKYIAHVFALDTIEGILSFTPEGGKTIEIPFNNIQDLKQVSLTLLTHGIYGRHDKKFFTEWSKLKLQKKVDTSRITSTANVILNFAHTQTHPTFIWLNRKNEKTKISTWNRSVNFALSGNELISLITGEAYLSLSNEWMDKYSENVEKNTYRVLQYDGVKGKIYYVSHELAFEDFLQKINIRTHQSLDGQELFNLAGLIKVKQWWSRTVNAKDKVVVESEPSNVTDFYKMRFLREKKKAIRINGQPQAKINFVKQADARFLIKLNGRWMKRNFKDRIWYERHNDGSGRDRLDYDCRYFARDIEKETPIIMEVDSILKQLRISGDEGPLDLSMASLIEESASSWTLSIPTNSEHIEIQMIHNLNGKFAITGLYNAVCERGRSGPRHAIRKNNTFEEASMEISVEALVEKLE